MIAKWIQATNRSVIGAASAPARRREASTNAWGQVSRPAREVRPPRILYLHLHLAPAWRTALVVVLVTVALAVIVALFTVTGFPTLSPSTVPHPQPAGF
jgi:hypothetical protein